MRHPRKNACRNLTIHVCCASKAVTQIAVDEFLAQFGSNVGTIKTVKLILAECLPIATCRCRQCTCIVVSLPVIEILIEIQPRFFTCYHGKQGQGVVREKFPLFRIGLSHNAVVSVARRQEVGAPCICRLIVSQMVECGIALHIESAIAVIHLYVKSGFVGRQSSERHLLRCPVCTLLRLIVIIHIVHIAEHRYARTRSETHGKQAGKIGFCRASTCFHVAHPPDAVLLLQVHIHYKTLVIEILS